MHSTSNENNLEWQKDIQIIESLNQYMKGLRQQISVLARVEDDGNLIQKSESLGRAKGICHKLHSLAIDAQTLMASSEGPTLVAPTRPLVVPPGNPRGTHQAATPQKQARDRGEMRRKEYVERQRRAGVILSPWRGALYKQPDGTIVGIPYASDQRRKNFWFLGLPKDKFSEAVLLCEADGTTLVEVSLPPAFFAKYGSQLGASQAGQRHFQVERRNGDVYVRVPSVGPANVSAYVREYPIN